MAACPNKRSYESACTSSLAESRSLGSFAVLLAWNLIMLAAAFLYLLGAYAHPGLLRLSGQVGAKVCDQVLALTWRQVTLRSRARASARLLRAGACVEPGWPTVRAIRRDGAAKLDKVALLKCRGQHARRLETDRVDADRAGAKNVLLGVVDEHALLGREAESLQRP